MADNKTLYQKQKSTRKAIRQKFSGAEYRRMFRTRIIVGTAILFAIVWAGFRFSPELANIFDLSVFIDALVAIAVIATVVNAYAGQGDFDEYNENASLKEEIKNYDNTVDSIDDYVVFSKQTRIYNKKRMQLVSENERLDHIEDLKTKLAVAVDKNKRRKERKLERKVAYWELQKDGKYVHSYKIKKFEPYSWQLFTNSKKTSKDKDISIDYKSSKSVTKKLNRYNAIRVMIFITLRASISSYIASSFWSFAIFTLIVICGSITGAIVSYEMTRDDIKVNEVDAIRFKHQELKTILNIKLNENLITQN